MKKIYIIFALIVSIFSTSFAHGDEGFSVDNCGEKLYFKKHPTRAIIHDINMAQMAFELGLQDKIVGLTGITGWYKTSPSFDKQRGNIKELAPKYPTLENILSVKPDIFFAGWYYGMKPGGEVTPQTLKQHGIKTLVLTESCVHLNKNRPEASMDLLFDDVLKLGKIFDVDARAKKLVNGWKEELKNIKSKTRWKFSKKVFLLDGPADKPFTIGKFAIPDSMIKAAGGKSITHNLDMSWGRTSWEEVAAKNPEFLILVDYQTGGGAKATFEFLQKHPAMSKTDAVKNANWIGLRYEEMTPGPANIEAIKKIAQKMFPEIKF